jgi:hypothetical protein
MAIFTPAELAEEITAWKAALRACAAGKSYAIGTGATNRSLTRQDLPEIRKQLEWLEQLQNQAAGRSGPLFVQARPTR